MGRAAARHNTHPQSAGPARNRGHDRPRYRQQAAARDIRQDIVERTDGIPLFIEEMTKAVLEAGGPDDAERAVASIPAPSLAVPASLHASLMARLDRLGSAKEVAQIGAVIGREFSHALLAAVARKEEAALQAALDGLTGAGLLFRQAYAAARDLPVQTCPGAGYGLQHSSPRAPTWVARPHCGSPGNPVPGNRREPAGAGCASLHRGRSDREVCRFLGQSGTAVVGRSALVEAIAQLNRALDQMATLTATPALRQEQIELQVAIITPLMHVKGHSSPEVKAATERARVLIEQAEALGEPPENPLLLYSVLYGAWITNVVGV